MDDGLARRYIITFYPDNLIMDTEESMTAKEFLKQFEYATQRAERCRRQYEDAQEKIDAIGSTLGGEPGMPHGTGISRRTEDKAIKLADAAAKWKEAEIDALIVKEQVFRLIWDIPGIEGQILYEKYINLKDWPIIASGLFYSESGIYKAHRRALRIVEKRLCNLSIERQ